MSKSSNYNLILYKEDIDILGRLCYSFTTRWCLSQPFTQQTHNSDIQPAINKGSILYWTITSLVIERVGGSLERIGSFLLKRISCRGRGSWRGLGLNLIIETDCLVTSCILALLPHHLHLVLDSLVTFLIAPVVNLLVSEPRPLSSVTLVKRMLKVERKYIFTIIFTSNEDPTGEYEERCWNKWPEFNPGPSDLGIQAGLLFGPGSTSSHYEWLEFCIPHVDAALYLFAGEVVELHGSLVLRLPAGEWFAERGEEIILTWLGLQVNQASIGCVLEVSGKNVLWLIFFYRYTHLARSGCLVLYWNITLFM